MDKPLSEKILFNMSLQEKNIASTSKDNGTLKEITNENLLIDRTADIMYLKYDMEYSSDDTDQEINDTLEDAFMYELDKTWDTGNIIFAQEAIKQYEGIIHKDYIDKAKNTINELIIEKIEDMEIN